MLDDLNKLLFRAIALKAGNKVNFHHLNKVASYEVPYNFVVDVIKLCDGTKSYNEAISSLSQEWEGKQVNGFIDEMINKNFIVISSNLSDEIWKMVENPMPFNSIGTEDDIDTLIAKGLTRHRTQNYDYSFTSKNNKYSDLLLKRKSTRSFSGKEISTEEVINLIWAAYGEFTDNTGAIHRTVPSAGGLYPISLHLALLADTENLPLGIYKVYYSEDAKVQLKLVSKDVFSLTRSFVNPSNLINGANGAVIISGSFDIPSIKYSNRALLYTLLEAGHVAQNIHLMAASQDISTLEIGGFVDRLIRESINLPEEYKPLISIIFGKDNDESLREDTNNYMEIDWAIPMSELYNPSFALASAKLPGDRDWSHGRDPSPQVALIKAKSEAREWASLGCIPTLKKAKFKDLKSRLDPRDVIKFHPSQYKLSYFPFKPFNDSVEYDWASGYKLKTGEKIDVLADLVHFPYYPDSGNYYCYANSSGCAAYPNELKAIQNGVFEILERDSFMNTYLSKLIRPTVSNKSLPEKLRKRIDKLEDCGFKVWIKDHTLEMAPVTFVFAQNNNLGFTICSSCSSFDVEYAIGHALMEIEGVVLSRMQNGRPKQMKPDEVYSPIEHSDLYSLSVYYQKSNFLIDGGDVISFSKIGAGGVSTWDDLLSVFDRKGLDVIIIPLELSDEYGGNCGLSIVRCIIPGLVPMTFGYRHEPGGVKRIYDVAERFGNKKLKYKDLTKFPHPFG